MVRIDRFRCPSSHCIILYIYTKTKMQRTIHTLGISQKKNLKVNKDEMNKKNKKNTIIRQPSKNGVFYGKVHH